MPPQVFEVMHPRPDLGLLPGDLVVARPGHPERPLVLERLLPLAVLREVLEGEEEGFRLLAGADGPSRSPRRSRRSERALRLLG